MINLIEKSKKSERLEKASGKIDKLFSFDKEQIGQALRANKSNFNVKKLFSILKELDKRADIELANYAYMLFIRLMRNGEISPFDFLAKHPMSFENK